MTMYPFFNLLVSCLPGISVEPPTVLVMIGINIYSIAADLGIYRVMCDKLFNVDGGTDLNDHQFFQCWDTSRPLGTGLDGNESQWWHQAEIILQQQTTTWSMANSLCSVIPSMISNVILGAYGDRRGRKKIMLLGLSGISLFMASVPILFAYPKTVPVYIMYIINVLASLTGFFNIVMASAAAYLTDTVKDKEMLTVRMSILQICTTIGIVLGPLIANALLNAFSYTVTSVVAVLFGCMAFVSTVLTVKNIRPKSIQVDIDPISIKVIESETGGCEKRSDMKKEVESGWETSSRNGIGEIWTVIKEVPTLLKESWQTVTKPREGHHRAYIFSAAFIIFVFSGVDATFNSTVFMLYVQKEPLSWTQNQISYFRSVANLIRLFGTVIGIFIFKKAIHMSDTLIIVLALASMVCQGLLIALSTNSWMLYAAASTGALASLSYPCAQAFAAKLMKADEVGKAFGAFSLFTATSYVFSSVAMGAVYHSTVAYFPTLVFVLCTAILVSALILAVWVHLDFRGNMIGTFAKRLCACFGPKEMHMVH